MNIKSIIKMAFQSILSNKIRTFLTMLGIIIGVFSVVVLISIGQGATSGVTENISSMGSNIINVNIMGRRSALDYKDVYDIELLTGIKSLTPVYSSSTTVKYGTESTSINVMGGNENYLSINNYEVGSGRAITPVDVEYRNKIALIGSSTAEDLFSGDEPLGKNISIGGEKYTVVGMLKEKSSSSTGDSNDIVIVPVTSLMRQNSINQVSSITVQANSSDESSVAKENIEDYLFDYFGDDSYYNVFSQDEMLKVLSETTSMLTAVLGGIAGISLLVGGIGIMNIMLVTVSERTKEIGVRKAIGAGRGHIMMQFLIESSVISGVGGITGSVLGVVASYFICKVMDINYSINLTVIIVTFIFSLAVGVFFGLYPANKASKLRPVDALRYE